MIGFIKGKIHALGDDYILLDHNGMGFRINFYKSEKLKIDQEVTIYTYQNVREDEISLYGFLTLKEYDLFVELIKVKGLGPKIASGILAKSNVDEILNAIATNDVDYIKRLPGIGAKTASQIILDLKGKLVQKEAIEDDRIKDVKDALKALGYKNNEFSNIISSLSKENLSTDEMIKKALVQLAKK